MADLNSSWLVAGQTRYCPLFYINIRVQCFQTALPSQYETRCLDCLVYFKVHAIFNLSCGRKNVLSRMCHPRLSSVSTHECSLKRAAEWRIIFAEFCGTKAFLNTFLSEFALISPESIKYHAIQQILEPKSTLLKEGQRLFQILSHSMAGWRAPRFWIPVKILNNNNSELHVLLTCVCQSPYFPTFFVICRQASRKTAQFISNVTFKSWARARKRNFSNWKLIVLAIWVSCCAWSPPKWPQSQQQTGTLMSLPDPSIHYCNCIELVCFDQYSLGAHNNPSPPLDLEFAQANF